MLSMYIIAYFIAEYFQSNKNYSRIHNKWKQSGAKWIPKHSSWTIAQTGQQLEMPFI